jgi:DNA-binding YbaB/EbfC family protein
MTERSDIHKSSIVNRQSSIVNSGLSGLGGTFMKGMGNMMKQAQQLQSKMLKMQEELADKTVESSSGGGMIRVVANGRQQVVSIHIEKEVVDPDDIEMLQDLVLAAVNDSLAKAQEMASAEMSKLTGGLNIPGLM